MDEGIREGKEARRGVEKEGKEVGIWQKRILKKKLQS